MNYASIEDWCLLYQSLQPWCPIDCNVYSYGDTIADGVKCLSDFGISMLKREDHTAMTAKQLDSLWFVSQSLKKFRLGCQASSEDAVSGFRTRNHNVLDHVPWHHLKRMRELLLLALPRVPDDDIIGHFGPGAVAEGFNVFQKWNSIRSWSFDARSLHLSSSEQGDKISPARLVAVPKDFSKYRLITVEPCENSFGQQYLRELLLRSVHCGALRGTVMDQIFGDSCQKQQHICVRSSSDGRRATLDLSNASDSISFGQICDVFPTWIVSLLERFRTPAFTHSSGTEDLRIYAGMGNATTFVVETLYFWAMVTSIQEWLHCSFEHVTVFGDDIICDNRAAQHPLFVDEVKRFGCELNLAKCGTSSGPGFREACGVCALDGRILRTLIRIPGYDLDDGGSRIDACDTISRLLNSDLGIHTVLGWLLYENTTLPSIHCDLHSSCGVIRSGIVPERDVPPCRWNLRNCYAEYHVAVRQPVYRRLVSQNLSPFEGLGVLAGYLDTRCDKRCRTVLSYALHMKSRIRIKWVY